MKTQISAICLGVLFVMTGAGAVFQIERNEEVERFVSNLDKMNKITERRYLMDIDAIQLCAARPKNMQKSVHVDYFCEVYTNDKGQKTLKTGEGEYPVGSVIIKAKFAGKEAKVAELFTVMRKMEPGYDAKHGDWEYSVVNGKNTRELARGKIGSCISCHKDYSSTDYVTRVYLKN